MTEGWYGQPMSGEPSPYGRPTPGPLQTNKGGKSTGWFVAIVAALIVGGGAGFAIGHSTASSNSASPETSHSRSAVAAPKTIDVHGTLDLTDPTGWTDVDGGNSADGDACAGTEGYDDITGGAQVIISTDAGKTLTIVALADGAVSDGNCEFDFAATVPKGYAYYGVEVGHRGVVKESAADLPAAALSLG